MSENAVLKDWSWELLGERRYLISGKLGGQIQVGRRSRGFAL